MNWNSKSSPEGATVSDRPRGWERMKAPNQGWPQQGVEEARGVLGGTGWLQQAETTVSILEKMRRQCQGEVIHLREPNEKEDFNCSKAPAKADEHP